MRAPFAGLDARALWRRLFGVLAAMLVVQTALIVVDGQLRSPVCPMGIVSFELAGDQSRLAAIIDDWRARPPASIYAAFSLGLDYLFMPLYSTVIALACVLGAAHQRPRAPRLADLGAALAWGAWIAAACDAVENAALWRALAHAPTETAARVAVTAATIKFALVVLGLVYALGSAVGGLVARGRS